MTLMTNDLNDHHDRMVVVEFFLFMIRKKVKPDALSSARLFLIFNPRYNPLTSFARNTNLKQLISHNGK